MQLSIAMEQYSIQRKATEDARQYVYRVLHQFIMQMILPPGQKLGESSISRSLQVSRTPAHDSLIRLSRENLVTMEPNKTAYVSRIDTSCLQDSIWNHYHLGIATLNSIYLNKTSGIDLDILNYLLNQMDQSIETNHLENMYRLTIEYYHRLYLLAGNLDHIWDSIMLSSTDFQRVLHLLCDNPVACKGLYKTFSELTDAVIAKNNDLSCYIFEKFLRQIHLSLQALKTQYPTFFI